MAYCAGLRKIVRIAFLSVLVIPLSAGRLFAAQMNQGQAAQTAAPLTLRAGAARIDVTPTDLRGLNSFGNGSFKGVHDPIYARALVLDNGVNTVAVVALDMIELGDTMPLRQRVQSELGIPAEHIIITASHDHNAPRIGPITPGGLAHPQTEQDKVYTAFVYNKIVEALRQAKASLQPAQFGIGTGEADINVNRDQYTESRGWFMGYNPNRQSDKTVWVLKFETTAGQPIAILFDYAVHSSVTLGTGMVSGDLGGAAERYVEARYDNKIVALYNMGPAGDQNPRVDGSGPIGESGTPPAAGAQYGPSPAVAQVMEHSNVPYQVVNALGLAVGAEVVRVANGVQNLSPTAHIEAAQRVVECPTKRGVHQLPDMVQAPVSKMPLHLSLIRINDVALVGVSGEVVTNIYYHLKKDSPLVDTIMLTIANDRAGYIADNAAYDTPYFEVNGSPFARGCAENAIVNNLTEMIKESR